jgi:hypothetical protein
MSHMDGSLGHHNRRDGQAVPCKDVGRAMVDHLQRGAC